MKKQYFSSFIFRRLLFFALVCMLIPAVMAASEDTGASEERAIRFSIPSAYTTGETVFAEGIANLPVGTNIYGIVKGTDSDFIYKVTKEYTVYEKGTDGWNKWKIYADTTGWNEGIYELTVYEPVSGAEKSNTFRLTEPESSPSGQQNTESSSSGTEERAIRMALKNTFYDGETVYVTGITNFPVGTYFDAYVKSSDSDFAYTLKEGGFVYQSSAETSGWNDWKLYIQPDGWNFGTYELTVTEPLTGTYKSGKFTLAEVPGNTDSQNQYTYENQRNIRFSLNKQYCINQTIEIDGITDLPAGSKLALQIEGVNVNFKWTAPEPLTVVAGSESEGWNSFKTSLNSGDIGTGTFTLKIMNENSETEKTAQFEITDKCDGIQTDLFEGDDNSEQELIEQLQKENEDLKKENSMLKQIIDLLSSLFGN